jgi:hypothetical protein
LRETKKVLRIELPADKNATLPLYPGEEAFDQPALGISPQPASFLRGALAAIGSVRRDCKFSRLSPPDRSCRSPGVE